MEKKDCTACAEPIPRPEADLSVSAPDPVIATATIKCGPEDGLFELVTFYGHRFEIDMRRYHDLHDRARAGAFFVKVLSSAMFDNLVLTSIPVRRIKEPKP